MSDHQDLLDYRRRVGEMYARVRRGPLDLAARCLEFRRARDELFRTHPQSALADVQKARFRGLRYYPHNPSLRFVLPLEGAVEPVTIEGTLRDDGFIRLRRIGKVQFAIEGTSVALSVFWIEGYGGGIFLPFRDRTNADATFESGRYLLDTIKGADLGQEDGKLIIDFNYAYNPSCAYNIRWDCPLAPPENALPVPIPAGEQRYAHDGTE